MTYALWVIAGCQVIRTMLDLRAARIKGLLPRVFHKNTQQKRLPRVTEMP